MGNFYFDLETSGLNPKQDRIIALQYEELDRSTGKAVGSLHILREWEYGEKGILEKFLNESGILKKYEFSFVPIGYNLGFKANFLRARLAENGLQQIDLIDRPFIDLRSFGVVMNRGEFRGSGLDRLTGKQSDGANVPKWYKAKEYGKIIRYIEDKASSFVKLNSWLYAEMPKFLERFKKESGV
ncbi:MAG TPA: hypothetical protein HA254_03770 [Candidatus Diapherotrites archaeon]|uniref:Uncharacterized protein n=1 Tax=Candidatus Iainarchaeum sp. TaxID=3101447 RepID=A0A7J4IW56_9ARCH|nr:hypothetical protein [Candidatus Diapherotrites archaeon]